MVAGRALEAQRRPRGDDVQAAVGVEHGRERHQVLLVAPAAVMEDQQALRVAVGGSLERGQGHRATE